MWKEFKAFILRGNVLDLAVAVMIGVAFGAVVTSFVKDIIMPPIGLLLGKIDFSSLYINLSGKAYASLAEAQKAGAATINYGVFINAIINFVIVGIVLFFVIKAANATKKPAPVAAPTTKECPFCCTTIALKAKRCPNCTSELKS
jgi:large conductance mechanosensitive channel